MSRKRAAPIGQIGLAVLVGVLGGCSFFGPPPVISSGSSTPAAERPGDPFARLEDRTVIPAYEFGLCDRDRDCHPTGCGGSVCSPNEEPATCSTDPVSQCFAAVPSTYCRCNEGACRWERTAPVMQCALLGADRPSNRPIRGNDDPDLYPIRHD